MRSISLGQVGEVVCESQTELGYTIVTFKGGRHFVDHVKPLKHRGTRFSMMCVGGGEF
jgi:hypothetical protein